MEKSKENVEFVKAWLAYNNIRVCYSDGEEVFIPKNQILKSTPILDYKFRNSMGPIEYSWEIGKDFSDAGEECRIISGDELKARGYMAVFSRLGDKYILRNGEPLSNDEWEPIE